jgi:hypothetical protein
MASGCLQANDFGSEVIPGAKDMGMHIQAYLYDGYWEDIGTVEAFYEANLALTDSPQPKFRYASSVTVFFAVFCMHAVLFLLKRPQGRLARAMWLTCNAISSLCVAMQLL